MSCSPRQAVVDAGDDHVDEDDDDDHDDYDYDW